MYLGLGTALDLRPGQELGYWSLRSHAHTALGFVFGFAAARSAKPTFLTIDSKISDSVCCIPHCQNVGVQTVPGQLFQPTLVLQCALISEARMIVVVLASEDVSVSEFGPRQSSAVFFSAFVINRW